MLQTEVAKLLGIKFPTKNSLEAYLYLPGVELGVTKDLPFLKYY